MWRTLSSGGLLLVAKPGAWIVPDYLIHLVCSQHATSLWGVPSPFGLMMDATQDAIHASLTDLHLSGEAFPSHLARRILTNNKHVKLFNPYGPAEVTINSHAYTVTDCDTEAESIPIGAALPNTSGWVLESHCAARPLLVPGELHLGGPKVSRGYLGRSNLACQVALPSQLPSSRAYDRIYRTGLYRHPTAMSTHSTIAYTICRVVQVPGTVQQCSHTPVHDDHTAVFEHCTTSIIHLLLTQCTAPQRQCSSVGQTPH